MVDPAHRELADAWFDLRLDAAGQARLEATLVADAAFAAWFADQCRREVALRAALRLERGVAVQRVRRVWSRRMRPAGRSTGGRPALALAAGLAVAALAALWLLRPQVADAILRSGDGVAVLRTGVPLPVRDGLALRRGDRLRVAGGAASILFSASGAAVRLDADGEAVIEVDGLRLDAGRASAVVPRQAAGGGFRIGTRHAVVAVIGTRFTVSIDGERSAVAVDEGTVAVTSPAGRQELRAGARASFPAPAPTSPVPASAPAPAPAPAAPTLGALDVTLLDALADRPLPAFAPLREGARIDLATLPARSLGLRVAVAGPVVGVGIEVIALSGGQRQHALELVPPFTFPGDEEGDTRATWNPAPGRYRIRAQAYADQKGRVPLGAALTLEVEVTGAP